MLLLRHRRWHLAPSPAGQGGAEGGAIAFLRDNSLGNQFLLAHGELDQGGNGRNEPRDPGGMGVPESAI